jgi:beta-galactosidase
MEEKLINQSTRFYWRPISLNSSIVLPPLFYRSTFNINISQPLHSFICTDNWGHGFIMINGFNIGRYSEKGPQRTMHVPASILKKGINRLIK